MVDIDALIYQNISSGLQLRMDLAAREAGSDHQYLTLLESTVDVCTRDSSDDRQQQDLLVSMMMDEMNKYGNLTIECPFETVSGSSTKSVSETVVVINTSLLG